MPVRTTRWARTAQKDDSTGKNPAVQDRKVPEVNLPSTDEGEIASGSVSPRDKTDAKDNVGHEEMLDSSSKREFPPKESEVPKTDSEEEEGTRIVSCITQVVFLLSLSLSRKTRRWGRGLCQ